VAVPSYSGWRAKTATSGRGATIEEARCLGSNGASQRADGAALDGQVAAKGKRPVRKLSRGQARVQDPRRDMTSPQ
jgi:hypothetical protein